jgi:XTP/dITP diphosphohydrolase
LTDPFKIILATRNEDKVREIGHILGSLPLALLSLKDFPGIPEIAEDGATFLENARKKALTVQELTGLASLADDSGLEVEALNGRPGIMSRRFAGPGATYADNNLKLIDQMKGIPFDSRRARFVCVAALAAPDGKVHLSEGELSGYIAESPRGEGGFGYDPLFYLPEYGKTVAELDAETKNAISHRAKAMGAMREILQTLARGDS